MMTKKESFQEELYYGFTLESKVSKDHLLRKIKEAVDFSFVYDLVEKHYSYTGAPSVDPVVIFKLSLIGYLYGIRSERRLMEEASLNLAYLWFIDYKITEEPPDHSIFTKTRIRFGADSYREFFQRIVRACQGAGLVEGETAFLDATLIDANTSDSSLRSRALVDQLEETAKKYIDALSWEDPEDNLLNKERRKQSEALSPKAKVNRRLVNPKDRDAQIIRYKDQKPRFAYKGHIVVDGGEARIITACSLTGGAFPEEHLLWQLVAEHESLTKRPLANVVADGRYSTSDNYRFLRAKGILPVIPLRKGGKGSDGTYKRQNFSYSKESNTFTCPEGKTLYPAKPVGDWKTYRSRKFDCNRCLKRKRCLPENAQRRTLMTSKNESILNWAKELLKTRMAKALLKKRKVWPETIFANAKELHGLKRARYRGRWKVEIQLLMTAAAMNLKKLVKYQGEAKRVATQKLAGAFLNLFRVLKTCVV